MKKLQSVLIAFVILALISVTAFATPRIPVYKSGSIFYFFDKSTGTITGFAGEVTTLCIPQTIGGYKVVSIGSGAFAGALSLKQVSISEGVATICANAFSACPNLTQVEIPSTVSYIGNHAFADCPSLSSVVFKIPLNGIEADAFDNTPWLNASSAEFVILGTNTLLKYNGTSESVIVPEGITSIADSAFAYNTAVKEVILPSTLHSIGENAFIHCYNLKSISIPSSLSRIGSGAFDDTIWLNNQQGDYVLANSILISYRGNEKHPELPVGIKAIGGGAFMANEDIRSVKLPEGILHIDAMAFCGCSELRLVNIPDSIEWIDEYAFAGCKKLTLHGAINSYSEQYAQYMQMPFSSVVYVSYNGERVYFDTAVPIIYYERTYLPLRALMELMGYDVRWDSTTGIVTCQKDSRTVTVSPAGEITINGVVSPTVAPPININGNNLVSARVIAEAVNAGVVWNDAARTVEISD